MVDEFEGEFECPGENTEKYITFSVPIKKENDNGKKNHIQIKVYWYLQIYVTSLTNLVDNLSGVYDKESKKCMERKKIR